MLGLCTTISLASMLGLIVGIIFGLSGLIWASATVFAVHTAIGIIVGIKTYKEMKKCTKKES